MTFFVQEIIGIINTIPYLYCIAYWNVLGDQMIKKREKKRIKEVAKHLHPITN